MKRGVKIGLICGAILVVLIGIGIFIYFNFFAKDTYQLVGVEITDFEVADFTDDTEIKFYKNNTFHIHIEHKDLGLSLTAIGTYTLENKTYHLEFTQAYSRNVYNEIENITSALNDENSDLPKISCTRSGNRIKFIDHKSQIYYFG